MAEESLSQLDSDESLPRRGRRRIQAPMSENRLVPVLVTLLSLAVVGSVLAIGAVHVPVLALTSLVACAAGLVATERGWATWPPPAWLALALAGYTALQAVPIPMGALSAIAPSNAETWLRSTLAFAEGPVRWAPLSLDPGATATESLKWLTYSLIFVAASALAFHRGSAAGVAIVFLSGLAAALATVFHGLFGMTEVYGLYQPTFEPAPWHVGPLLNPNNLAGYLVLSSFCGVGLLLSRRTSAPRWLLSAAISVMIAVCVTTASRGGIAVLPVGALALAVLLRSSRGAKGEKAEAPAGRWVALAAVGAGLGLAALGASSTTWFELWDHSLDKLSVLQWVVPMIAAHPWFGVGRGAFESTFPAYRDAPGSAVYSHAECFPAEWAAGWGVPVALLALSGFAWHFRPTRLGAARSAVAAGAWTGVLCVSLHNLVDLGFEVPAVGIAAAATLGSLWGGDLRRKARNADRQVARRPSRLYGIFVAAAVGLLGATCVLWARDSVADERREIHAKLSGLADDPDSISKLRREVRQAISRHPAEPYFPLVGALLARRTADQDPIPWLARALERDATNGRAHLVLADVLASRNALGQALMELRFAARDDPALSRLVAKRAAKWTRDCNRIAEVAMEGPAGASMLATLASEQLPDKTRQECGEQLVTEALSRAPHEPLVRGVAAAFLLERMRREGTDCKGRNMPRCEAELLGHLDALEAGRPDTFEPVRLRVELHRLKSEFAKAEQLLMERCFAVRENLKCLRLRVEIASGMHPPSRLVHAIKDYIGVACTDPTACAEAHDTVGAVMSARADWATATTHYERAAAEQPTAVRWLRLAESATRAGMHGQALFALEKASAAGGGTDATLLHRIDDAKARALRGSQ